jgi:alkylation response protein AidB-like acyl-CoA dehydrogenase
MSVSATKFHLLPAYAYAGNQEARWRPPLATTTDEPVPKFRITNRPTGIDRQLMAAVTAEQRGGGHWSYSAGFD